MNKKLGSSPLNKDDKEHTRSCCGDDTNGNNLINGRLKSLVTGHVRD